MGSQMVVEEKERAIGPGCMQVVWPERPLEEGMPGEELSSGFRHCPIDWPISCEWRIWTGDDWHFVFVFDNSEANHVLQHGR